MNVEDTPLFNCRVDLEYQKVINDVLTNGDWVTTRGHKCKRIINDCRVFHKTPLISVRNTAWKNSLREWEWFMSGSNSVNDLHPAVRKWWEPWADKGGKIPYNYSRQFRHFIGNRGEVGEYDQIQGLITGIRTHPYSRRNVITTWNTYEMNLKDCPITNCHGTMIQCFVEPPSKHPIREVEKEERLSMMMVQRSCDVICGVPHNWFQYWAFLTWLAARTGFPVGEFHWIGTDVHIYEQHVLMAERICDAPLAGIHTPTLAYTPSSTEFRADDFSLENDDPTYNAPYQSLIKESVEMIV